MVAAALCRGVRATATRGNVHLKTEWWTHEGCELPPDKNAAVCEPFITETADAWRSKKKFLTTVTRFHLLRFPP